MLGFLRGCAGSEHDGRSGNRREYRFAWIPHDAFPLGLIFPNQTIRATRLSIKHRNYLPVLADIGIQDQ
jgi:hypothetical protein